MKSKKSQWDGRSRISTDTYKKNFNKIFGVKKVSLQDIKTPYEELQDELVKGDKKFGEMKRKKEMKRQADMQSDNLEMEEYLEELKHKL